MGREPATVSTHEYVKGRLVSVVTVREPEFTERDRLLILAQRREEEVPQNAHGIPLTEATDPANANAFEAVGPTTDFAEEALAKAQAKYSRDWPEAETAGHLWGIRRKS